MIAKGYSLWLMPEGENYNKLSSLIKKFGVKYQTPIFEPHITLLGEIIEEKNKILLKTEELSHYLEKVTICLEDTNYSDKYFQSLFFTVEKNKKIMQANSLAKKIFEKDDEDFVPHLSTMYGYLPKKEKIFLSNKIKKLLPMSFECRKIFLISSEGIPKEWKKISGFKIGL